MIVQEKKFKVKKMIVVNLDVCREKNLSKMGIKFISGGEFTMSRPTLMEVLNILL